VALRVSQRLAAGARGMRGRARWSSRTRRAALVGGAAVLAFALTACGGSRVVSSNSLRFYVRVPANWKVYSKAEMLRTAKFAALVSNPPEFLVSASADPRHPNASQPFSASKYPWAILLVNNVSGSARLSLTLESLSDVLVNVDELSQEGVPVQELKQGSLLVNGGLRGTKVAFQVGTGGSAIDYEQATWVNAATDRLWTLMVGCSPDCYKTQDSAIDGVVQSFYVSDRGT
jgi:hypothetical protein